MSLRRRLIPKAFRDDPLPGGFALTGFIVTLLVMAVVGVRGENTREIATNTETIVRSLCTTVKSDACHAQALVLAEVCLRDDECVRLVTATVKRGKSLPPLKGGGALGQTKSPPGLPGQLRLPVPDIERVLRTVPEPPEPIPHPADIEPPAEVPDEVVVPVPDVPPDGE